ncbi:hypothetical protein TRFO_35255 [Tritrichomonas foetus]|uniref:Uncharacterized protein n=1 Tax=Tritrichomonas foetus TaxID=1144522 RepID=A0A1J4JM14_9EUKA|nr:hypothetical protein TRFO_35255 [Tritrichomonas foetus]|eukprot:OHS98316.1 hypothetical protein TRFO_35255 [Tritrichomonas foetus]
MGKSNFNELCALPKFSMFFLLPFLTFQKGINNTCRVCISTVSYINILKRSMRQTPEFFDNEIKSFCAMLSSPNDEICYDLLKDDYADDMFEDVYKNPRPMNSIYENCAKYNYCPPIKEGIFQKVKSKLRLGEKVEEDEPLKDSKGKYEDAVDRVTEAIEAGVEKGVEVGKKTLKFGRELWNKGVQAVKQNYEKAEIDQKVKKPMNNLIEKIKDTIDDFVELEDDEM